MHHRKLLRRQISSIRLKWRLLSVNIIMSYRSSRQNYPLCWSESRRRCHLMKGENISQQLQLLEGSKFGTRPSASEPIPSLSDVRQDKGLDGWSALANQRFCPNLVSDDSTSQTATEKLIWCRKAAIGNREEPFQIKLPSSGAR
jgi:hypothetical protein